MNDSPRKAVVIGGGTGAPVSIRVLLGLGWQVSAVVAMADEVLAEVKRSVELTPGVKSCEIELVFDPVWDTSLLSDEARITLGMD